MKTHRKSMYHLWASWLRVSVVVGMVLALTFSALELTPAQAADGDIVWAKAMGGTASDYGYSIAVDGSGNVYTTGRFQGTVDFDPGAGTANLTAAGADDIFVSKLDASGDYVWARRMGGTSLDEGQAIAVDGSGNVYTTGRFQGTADFDPGVGTTNLTAAGADDIFVSKLDASGDYVWARRMGGTSLDEGQAIAVDGSGNVYTTGRFQGTVDFDPGVGTVNRTSAGSDDIFVSKLDASGNYAWAKAMGWTSQDEGRAIAVDGSGSVYTTGRFQGTADFDPGVGTANLTAAGGNDIFVSKLDASGDYVWAKAMGGVSADYGNSIAVDGSGSVYTTGRFQGTVDFDPGAATANLTAAGANDIFVSKLDASGDYVWARRMGGTLLDEGQAIAVDGSGNVYTTGLFQGTVDFDPGAGTANRTSAGADDIFVSKLDASGNFVWAKAMGGTAGDYGYSIAVDGSGNVYTTGRFQDTVDFDPGVGTANLTAAGADDIFVSKLQGGYTVTFDGNLADGGAMSPQTSSVPANLTLNAFTRTGYTFAGWNTAANGSGTAYANGATYSFSADMNLTAQWTAIAYTVTYALGGGSGSVPTDSTNYHIGDTVTVEFTPLPTRTGYTFAGWSDGATTYTSGGTESFTMGSSNVTLTAEWTAINYTVTYALGGGSGSVPTDSTNYHIGDTVTVEFTPLPTRTGYTFVGWSDGATTYTSGGTESFTDGQQQRHADRAVDGERVHRHLCLGRRKRLGPDRQHQLPHRRHGHGRVHPAAHPYRLHLRGLERWRHHLHQRRHRKLHHGQQRHADRGVDGERVHHHLRQPRWLRRSMTSPCLTAQP